MLILVWFIVCIIFAFVQLILGDSGHALELFALLSAIALFLISKISIYWDKALKISSALSLLPKPIESVLNSSP